MTPFPSRGDPQGDPAQSRGAGVPHATLRHAQVAEGTDDAVVVTPRRSGSRPEMTPGTSVSIPICIPGEEIGDPSHAFRLSRQVRALRPGLSFLVTRNGASPTCCYWRRSPGHRPGTFLSAAASRIAGSAPLQGGGEFGLRGGRAREVIGVGPRSGTDTGDHRPNGPRSRGRCGASISPISADHEFHGVGTCGSDTPSSVRTTGAIAAPRRWRPSPCTTAGPSACGSCATWPAPTASARTSWRWCRPPSGSASRPRPSRGRTRPWPRFPCRPSHTSAPRKGVGHFVVLHRVRKDSVVVADPSRGIVSLSRDEFCRRLDRAPAAGGPEPGAASRDAGDDAPSARGVGSSACSAPHSAVLAEAFVCACS